MQFNENTRKWADALESGNYIQGSGRLMRAPASISPSYCCLGVGADVIGQLNHHGEVVGHNENLHFEGNSGTSLFNDQLTELGITATEQSYLISMNDSGSYTFADIARILRDGETNPNAIDQAHHEFRGRN